MAGCTTQNIINLGACSYPDLVDNGNGTFTFFPGDGNSIIFSTSSIASAIYDNGTRTITITEDDGTETQIILDIDASAIDVIPNGNLTSDKLDDALNELQYQINYINLFDIESNLRLWSSSINDFIINLTRNDYSNDVLEPGDAGFIQITATIEWPDKSLGHLDGIEYADRPGILQYFTASHENSGKIIIKEPLVDGVSSIVIITPDYYIDSNVSVSGYGSVASPYKYINNVLFSDNVIIALKSNSVFNEELILPQGAQAFRYGTGNKPKVTGSEILNSALWTLSAGYTNIYQQTVLCDLHDSLTFINVRENNELITRVHTLAECETTPKSVYVSTDIGSDDESVIIYIHPSNDTNPITNGNIYDYTRRKYAYRSNDLGGNVIDGIIFSFCSIESGPIILNGIARHCDALFGNKHNIYMRDGSECYGVKAIDQEYNPLDSTPDATYFVINEDDAVYGGKLYECVGMSTIYDAEPNGILSHKNSGTGQFEHTIISRCYWKNISAATSGIRDTVVTDIIRNVIVDCRNGINSATTDGTDIYIDNCYIDTINASAGSSGIAVLYTNANVTITNNIIKQSGVTANYMVYTNTSGIVTVIDNQFILDGLVGSTRRGIDISNGDAKLFHYRNKYSGNFNRYISIRNIGNGAATVYSNNNIYNVAAIWYTDFNSYGSLNIDMWRINTNQDTASVIENKAITAGTITNIIKLPPGATALNIEDSTASILISILSDGGLVFNNIKTTNPNNAGEIWNDGGILKVSSG